MKSKLYEICDKMLHNSWADHAEYVTAVRYREKLRAELNDFDPALAEAMDDLEQFYVREMENAEQNEHKKMEQEKADKYMEDHPEEFLVFPFDDLLFENDLLIMEEFEDK